MNELDLIIKIAKGYNNLDPQEILNVVSEDVVYESQNVFSALRGKIEFTEYLIPKFKTIKELNNLVYAEIGFLGFTEETYTINKKQLVAGHA